VRDLAAAYRSSSAVFDNNLSKCLFLLLLLDQELISYLILVLLFVFFLLGRPIQKSLRRRRFK